MSDDTNKTVFISYRRSVAAYVARAVFQDLRAHGWDVFMDVESIDAGEFDRIILNQIAARAHFVVILTPGALERCAEPDDWLRREIECAFEKDRNIVPLLTNGFDFASNERYLIGQLAELRRRNGLNVPYDYFEEAMDRLRTRYLKQPVYGAIVPAPSNEQAEIARRVNMTEAQPRVTSEELTAEQYFNQAMELNDNSPQEIELYNKAIERNPKYAQAYNNRASARHANGDLDGALADYDEALLLDPKYALAYYNRGVVRQANDDFDGAIVDYTEAIRLDPKYAIAYNNRGLARKNLGDREGATADYTEAIRLDPKYAVAYNNRGIVRHDANDPDGAVADYNEALNLDPAYIDAYYNRALVRKDNGDLEGAIEDYQQYLDLGGGLRDGDQAVVEQMIRDLKQQLGQS